MQALQAVVCSLRCQPCLLSSLLSDAPQNPACHPETTARNTASNSEAAEEENEEEADLEEDENAGIVDERPGLAHSDVVLARRPGELCVVSFCIFLI